MSFHNLLGIEPVWVWGLPFAPLTLAETVETVAVLIERGLPSFFITANTHYAMLTEENPDLRQVNARAAFLVADGAPLVWAAGACLCICRSELPDRI